MAKYKFKLSEMSKKGSPKQAEEEFDSPYETLKVGKVSFSDDGTSKSTITNIDPETGAVSWRIDQLPGFDKLYDEIDDLVDVAKRVYVKTKDDKKFREFYDEIRVIRNKIRTHLRNEYPDQYKRITRIGESELNEMIDLVHVMEPDGSLYGTGQIVGVEKDKTIVRFDGETVKRFPSDRVVPVQEEEVDEVSLSGAAGSYLTPYAFRKKGQKPNDIVYKELGYKVVKENYRGVEFEDYIDELEKTMYVERQSGDRIVIHPLDKPDVRRPGRDYIVIDGNNVIAVQGYNSGPISVLADRYGLDEKDSRLTPTGKTTATGRISLLSSNILKDAIKAIEDSRDAEAKRQQDYYSRRGPVSGIGNLDEGDTYEKMAAKGKKAGNLKQGTVRKRLNIPKGEKIPLSKINKEISRIKKMENPSEKNKKYLKALNLAKTLKTTTNVNELNQSFSIGDELTLDDRKGKVVKVMDDMLNVDFGNGDVYGITLSRIKGDKIFKEAKDPGATLGPGPKAGPDGVDDNYYVKAFKYKLVPKKNGTYVQKGSGLEVKKLF